MLQINQFDPIASCINSLQEAGKVIVDGENAALQNIYQTEVDIARLMKNLVEKKKIKKREQYDDKKVEQAIKDAEKELKIHYDDTQKLAIKNAVNQPISILTGGPVQVKLLSLMEFY